MAFQSDVLVIGAGLAGLTAARQAAVAGKRVRLVAKGWGATHWHAGCIDVLGYSSGAATTPIGSPMAGVEELIQANPEHPYALVGLAGLEEALSDLSQLCQASDYPLHGSLNENLLLPSAVGAMRPTCLAPEMMIGGDMRRSEPMLVVGFTRLVDFYAGLVADNLSQQGIPAEGIMVELAALDQRRSLNPVILARLFDQATFRDEVVQAVKPHLGTAERIGFPAVLGLERPLAVKADLEARLGQPVFEIPTLPPSVPGMRLHRILMAAIKGHGGRVFDGMEAIGTETESGRVTVVYTEAAARKRPQRAPAVILATGGLLGGGIVTDHKGNVRETIFDLPLRSVAPQSGWFKRDFFDPDGQPIDRAGIQIDASFRPLDGRGQPVFENLLVAGTTYANCDFLRRRSFEGVAITTGFWAGKKAAEDEAS